MPNQHERRIANMAPDLSHAPTADAALAARETTKTKQRAAILDALHSGPLTTVAAREELGVLHPGGRVLELRKRGYVIDTQSRTEFDALGRPHRVAAYILRGVA